jgi:hypothetical protein
MLRVEANRNAQPAAQPFDHRQDARHLLFVRDGFGAGARGFSADVENIRSRPFHLQRASDGRLRIEIFAAIEETVGRHVENAHHERAAAQHERS